MDCHPAPAGMHVAGGPTSAGAASDRPRCAGGPVLAHHPLPVPRPSIPPGYAITGKPAYLVTGGVVRPNAYIDTTPLGPLVVHATGTYFVDWGDGTSPAWSGPYQSEGLPYPDGNIAHTYDNVGTVTVTLRERWTATWSLGPEAGTLGGLATVATIADFPIRQLQAIITN